MHETGISEQCDDKLAIHAAVHSAGENLVYEVVHYAVQEIVHWKLKEHILVRNYYQFRIDVGQIDTHQLRSQHLMF